MIEQIEDDAVSIRNDSRAGRELFRARGFIVERGLVPRPVCETLLEVAAGRPSALDASFAPIPMPHLDHPEFLAFMRFPPIVAIVEQLVGGRASGLGGEFFYGRPGTPGFFAHQDNFYLQAPPDALVSAWTALCDIGSDNGGLVFYPGSQLLGELPIRKGYMIEDRAQNPGARAVECIFPAAMPTHEPVMKIGDVVFFHALLAHASNDNSSTRFRHSYLATYIRSGEPFRAGSAQQRREIDLHA
jgi:ectoine hydroxylase-related dioxygenase (phytanoyl-CoA dioxygenase family)